MKAVKFNDCPEGLFWFGDVHLGFMSEYSTRNDSGHYQRDAYVVASGEYFWGGAKTAQERGELMVTPIDLDQVITALSAASPSSKEGE